MKEEPLNAHAQIDVPSQDPLASLTTVALSLNLKSENIDGLDGPSVSPNTSSQQFYIIQTAEDGTIPAAEAGEVIVAHDDSSVFETVTALEQLRSGEMVQTETGDILQIYDEIPIQSNNLLNGQNHSRLKNGEVVVEPIRQYSAVRTIHKINVGQVDYELCRECKQFIAVGDIPEHNVIFHCSGVVNDLTCINCGKVFKSKRSLLGHRKEKHSVGMPEYHQCPECGKAFGRKSNLKAHRESLHFGRKFPCSFCDRLFTNRSSMNQHIKKNHFKKSTTVDSSADNSLALVINTETDDVALSHQVQHIQVPLPRS